MQDGFIDLSYHPFRESSGEITGLFAVVIDELGELHGDRFQVSQTSGPCRAFGTARAYAVSLKTSSAMHSSTPS